MITKKLRRYFQNFHENYLTASKQIAIAKNRNRTKVLLKMIACRLLFRHNTIFYGLYNLDDRTLNECSEFLTKQGMNEILEKLNFSKDTHLVANKLLFYERCIAHQIPTPSILGVLRVIPTHLPMGIPEISTEDQLYAFLLKHQNKRLVFKIIDGTYGIGFLSIMLTNGQITDSSNKILTVHDVFTHCREHRNSFLIQPHLASHSDLKPLMPGPALGTVRLMTIYHHHLQAAIILPYAILKVPRGSNIIDSFKHGNTGNLLCRIDSENGKLLDGWCKLEDSPSTSRIERHPDTLLLFHDFKIPFWPDVVGLVTRAAAAFPELSTLGWDVAITDKGAVVVEANSRYDIYIAQIVLNRGLKSEIKALYHISQSN